MTFLAPWLRKAEHTEKVMSQSIDSCDYCNVCAFFVRSKQTKHPSEHVGEQMQRHSIGSKPEQMRLCIEKCNLGTGYSPKLCDNWVCYLKAKKSAGCAGQNTWQVNKTKDSIITEVVVTVVPHCSLSAEACKNYP